MMSITLHILKPLNIFQVGVTYLQLILSLENDFSVSLSEMCHLKPNTEQMQRLQIAKELTFNN